MKGGGKVGTTQRRQARRCEHGNRLESATVGIVSGNPKQKKKQVHRPRKVRIERERERTHNKTKTQHPSLIYMRGYREIDMRTHIILCRIQPCKVAQLPIHCTHIVMCNGEYRNRGGRKREKIVWVGGGESKGSSGGGWGTHPRFGARRLQQSANLRLSIDIAVRCCM